LATILVVDDRPPNREFLVTLLGYCGHVLLEASDGVEALDVVRTRHPDLVISDILMPSMDGVEFVRRLRGDASAAATPVIFYTATYRLREAQELGLSCGVTSVLPKPSEPQVMLMAVNAALGKPFPTTANLHTPTELALRAGADSTPDKTQNYRQDLLLLQQQLQHDLDTGLRLLDEPGELQRLSSRLTALLTQTQSLGLRLTTLIELGLDLASERDATRLLNAFVRGAQDILSSKYAGVGLVGSEGQILLLAIRGVSEPVHAAFECLSVSTGTLSDVLVTGRPQLGKGGGNARLGLPPEHPPVRALAAVPVKSGERVHGWLYVANKIGAEEFSTEDVRIAVTLAAQLALAYENLVLYNDVRQYAQQLEREVVQRQQAEAGLARLNRIYSVLHAINAAIVRVSERQVLLDETCRIAVELGQFGMVWIGLLSSESRRLNTVASSGVGRETLERLQRDSAVNNFIPEGMVQKALKTGTATLCNDLRTAPHIDVICAEALTRGYYSQLTLPLLVDDCAIGVIKLFARETSFFDDQEMRLLTGLAGDISLALQYIDREERLQFLAYYDELTGLPNRALFLDRLAQFLLGAKQTGLGVAVILVDIVRFKQLNDALGRQVGDALLKMIGQRLAVALREPCCVARVAADMFAIAVAALPANADAIGILRNGIFEPFEQPFTMIAGAPRIAVRAGITLYPDDGPDAETLMIRAEAALKQAKTTGEEYLYYAPEMNIRAADKLLLEESLRTALQMEQFEVHYQPRVSLKSGEIVGAEALIRWRHPQRGQIPPITFIPLAEEIGLIVPIGAWVLRTVCAQQAAWLAAQRRVVPVAVNLSAAQLRKKEIQRTVQKILDFNNLSPHYLELELTETAVMKDLAEATEALHALHDIGIGLALDDFGTGYSSLAYLKRFPFDVVKIDRSFVADITSNPEDAAIADAVIAMAHRLNLRVVAEGVETAEQLDYLRRQDCDEMQGYYFSAAIPSVEFETMLNTPKRLIFPP
jgi:diguanylate cyclase (GGDEF)-like protein